MPTVLLGDDSGKRCSGMCTVTFVVSTILLLLILGVAVAIFVRLRKQGTTVPVAQPILNATAAPIGPQQSALLSAAPVVGQPNALMLTSREALGATVGQSVTVATPSNPASAFNGKTLVITNVNPTQRSVQVDISNVPQLSTTVLPPGSTISISPGLLTGGASPTAGLYNPNAYSNGSSPFGYDYGKNGSNTYGNNGTNAYGNNGSNASAYGNSAYGTNAYGNNSSNAYGNNLGNVFGNYGSGVGSGAGSGYGAGYGYPGSY
jgi:hypothetical protein